MNPVLRRLAKAPGFAVVVILTLAVGIGVTTALFTASRALLLRPLPVAQPEQLAVVNMPFSVYASEPASWRLYEEFARQAKSCAAVFATYAPNDPRFITLNRAEGVQRDFVQLEFVTGTYFPGLAIIPGAGRLLAPADDQRNAVQTAAVISDAFWRSRFGADRAVVGQTLRIGSVLCTIVGVAPREFGGVEVGRKIDVWFPMQARALLEPHAGPLGEDDQMGTVLVRLRPGITRAEAQLELERIFQQELARRRGGKTSGDDRWRRYFVGRTLELLPAASGLHPPGGLRERFGGPLTLLTGAAVVVLLAACANVAGLVLARSVRRQREFAVRVALGASRRRLVAHIVGETVVLSLAGGVLGWWVAHAGTAGLTKLIPEGRWTLDLRPDVMVFGFAALLTMSAGILCGLLPALCASRVDLVASIKASDGNHTGATGLFQQLLVIAQIASSVVLIVVAGLFWETASRLRAADLGFDRIRLLTFGLESDPANAPGAAHYLRLLEEIDRLPGIDGATMSSVTPVEGGWRRHFAIDGYKTRSDEVLSASWVPVGPRFFETMKIPLRRGRGFEPQHFVGERPRAAVIGDTMARTFFGTRDPVGQRFKAGRDTLEIVGVAGDVNYEGPRDAPRFTFYEPYLPSSTETRQMFYTIRTRGEPATVAADVRRIAERLTPDARVSRFRTVEDIVDTALVREQAIMRLCGWFGAFTLCLAGLGVFGLLAFDVARRTREFGTRIALGAQLRDIVKLVMKRGLSLVGVGCFLGVLGGMAIQRLISSLLVGTVTSQAGLFAAAIALLMIVAAIACWLPARRATKVDPLIALRSE